MRVRIWQLQKVTSKGQITIPADVGSALRVASGDRVEFVEIEPGRHEIIAATGSIRELKGVFGEVKQCVSIDVIKRRLHHRVLRLRDRDRY